MPLSAFHRFRRLCRTRRAGIALGLGLLFSLTCISSLYAVTDITLFGPQRYDRLTGKPTVYTDMFEGCASSDQGFLRVRNGDGKKTRVKSARIYLNDVKIASEKEFKQKVPSFEKPVTLRNTDNELRVVLKSGHHGYIEKLAVYQAEREGLEKRLARLHELRKTFGGAVTSEDPERALQAVREAMKGIEANEARLDGLSRGLDDDADGKDNDPDDEPEPDFEWAGAERSKFETHRNAVRESLRRCEEARKELDRTPKNKRDKDHGKKDETLNEIAVLLRNLDRAIEKIIDKLAEIEKKIELLGKREPSFLVIEVLGRDCDSTSPAISGTEPADGSVLNSPVPRIAASYADNPGGAGIDTASAKLVLDGSDLTSSASVTATGISYTPPSALPDGTHAVTATVADLARNAASLTWHFSIDTVPPAVRIDTPAAEAHLNSLAIAVTGNVSEPPASVTVNGRTATVSGTSFSLADLALFEGANIIAVEASDAAGNSGTASITVYLDTKPPGIQVTAPAPGSFLNTPSITVTGTVDEPVTSVIVNGTAAELSGSTFIASGVTLAEGTNDVTVAATDRAGNNGTAVVTLNLDTAAPSIAVTAPQAGTFLNTPSITVSGSVDEPVTVLTVGGMAATLNGLTFSRSAYALAEGQNLITVRAVDRASNENTITVPLTLDTTPPVVTISSPQNGLLTNVPAVTVSGTVSEPVTGVTVNGSSASVSGTVYHLAGAALLEGSNTISVSAVDRAGNSGTAGVAVTLDSLPPSPPLLTVPAAATNVGVVTVSGTAEPGSTVDLYRTGGQDPLSTATTDSQGAFGFPDIALFDGNNSFTAFASDAAGNRSNPSEPAVIAFDTTPPVITIAEPVNNSITNQAQVLTLGSVNEPATLEINGSAVDLQGLSFEHGMTLTEGINSIQATARDLAGNSATVTVLVSLDTVPPVVKITGPQDGFLTNDGGTTVTGTVNEPVLSVTVNGTAATVSGLFFTLPSFTLAEGGNTITAEAVDRAGNSGSENVSVTLDSTPPTVNITAPGEASAGATVTVSTGAADGTGLTLAELSANGYSLWSSMLNGEPSTQSALSYTLSPDLLSGASVLLMARAYDRAGNVGSATAQVQITGGPSGPGFIQGEAYDDAKGLRLEGVNVDITAAAGNEETRITTGADGGYFTEAPAGGYLATMTKPGFTTVERVLEVRPEKKTVAVDARLTPINAAQNLIDGNGGIIKGLLAAGGPGSTRMEAELNVPAGALSGTADIRLTPLSNQGLADLLPPGWSPIGVADIRSFTPEGAEIAGGTSFGSPGAALKLPVSSDLGLSPSSSVTLVRYDAASHQWIVQNPAAVSADGASIAAPIPSTGQYALALSDTGTVVAAAGQPLASLDSGSPALDPSGISASGRVVPPAAPPSIGLRAIGEIILSLAAPGGEETLHSGLVINGRVTERFDLISGDAVVPSDYIQDLVLYRYPCVTNMESGSMGQGSSPDAVQTTFPVTPSREYTITELAMGKVGIEITLPDRQAETGALVGVDGGRLLDADGNVLAIPPGALTGTAPIETRTVPVSILSNVIGNDFTLIRAVSLNLSGRTLAASAELSVPAPAGVDASLPLLVAKAIDVRGAQKLKLVALATLSGSLITSSMTSVPSVANSLTGVVSSGTYFFLQAKAPLGFVTGTVTGVSGSPFAYALTTSSTCSLADLTGADGRYLVPSTVSAFTASALDVLKNDGGSAAGTIHAANETVSLDLVVQAKPPTVLSAAPIEVDKDGNAYPTTAVNVTFSEPVKRDTVTSVDGNAITLADASGADIKGTFSVSPDGAVYSFYPESLLLTEATYTIRVAATVQDLQGYPLGQVFQTTFAVRDMTPPPAPPPGSITGTFPDDEGYVTINGTRGSSPADCTVLIINDSTGEIVAVMPKTDGSFTGRVTAQLGDEIRIVLMDQAGNETPVQYIALKSPDGKYLVTAKGGIVEGEGGTQLVIPEGALSGPTVIKISPVAEDQLPQPVPPNAGYLAAVNIDTGGVAFRKPVEFSVPVPAKADDIPEGSMPFVSQPSELENADGTKEKVYVIHDSARVVDGRLTTACEPFPGILVGGFFVFEYPYFTAGIVDGYTYREMDGIDGYLPGGGDLPVKRAVIRTPAAWQHISYSSESGFYAAFTELIGNVPGMPAKEFSLTAIHPLTMKRVDAGFLLSAENNIVHLFNIQLAGQNDMPPDTMAPIINFGMQIAPNSSQDGDHQDVRFIAGTIPIGTNLQTAISIIDRDIAYATLTVTCSGFCTQTQYSAPLNQTASTVYTPVSAENMVATSKFTYAPQFSGNIGSGGAFFTPGEAAAYTLTLDATDSAGNHSRRSLSVRAVDPASVPTEGRDGAPRIDEILPADNSGGVMVDTKIEITFSEPMDDATINDSTVSMKNLATDENVPVAFEFVVESSRTRAILKPLQYLSFDTSYKVTVSQDVRDLFPNASPPVPANQLDENGTMALDQEYVTVFTTKTPQVFDVTPLLDDTQPFRDAKDIALFSTTVFNPQTQMDEDHTYAYVITHGYGWRIVDVTDPTNAFVVYSEPWGTGIVNLRGVAVDPDLKLMAMTELLMFPGSYTGMIRFYDLSNTPAAPPSVGREKLAENSSGAPGKVALSDGYAYVATAMVGLQVVDINIAKQASGITHGESIVGGLPTVDMGYGNPLDIVVYRSGRGLLTTTKGHLMTLELNPSMPQILSPYKPAGFSAWRTAAAADYEYTDDQGNTQTMDLAIANGSDGKISTVDISDPYNPQHFTIKDETGSDRTDFFVSDIVINKTAHLAYAVSGGVVYVFDISNPREPRLLGDPITSAPTGGSATTSPLGYSLGLVEKDGWIYLASGEKGLKTLSFLSAFLKLSCYDPEYPNSKLLCRDYYPALGKKKIVLEARDNKMQPLQSPMTVRLVNATSGVTVEPARATFNNGYATFDIETPQTFAGDAFVMSFQVEDTAQQVSTAPSTNAHIDVSFRVRNNSNVNMQEVIAGEAVFTFDSICNDNHKGKTTDNTYLKKEIDFVQKMINHILVPLRTPPAETNIKNTIPVNGCYLDKTRDALTAIISSGTDPTGTPLVSNIKVSHHDDQNAKVTFNKLIKDYKGITSADKGKVIDREILIGTKWKEADKHPQSEDIGILELYLNDDWDGDGISNYMEVENNSEVMLALVCSNSPPQIYGTERATDPVPGCGQATYAQATVTYSENVKQRFDPLSDTVTAEAQELIGTARRGIYGNGEMLKLHSLVDTGEFSFANRSAGLRIASNDKGYYYYASADRDDTDNYALLSTLQKLERIGRKWAERHPDLAPLNAQAFPVNGQGGYHPPVPNVEPACAGKNIYYSNNDPSVGGIRFGAGDFSRAGGGVFYGVKQNKIVFDSTKYNNGDLIDLDHSSHQSGTDVDVYYMRRPICGEGGVNFDDDATKQAYDRDLTFELMTLFAEEGAKIFFVDNYGRARIFNQIDQITKEQQWNVAQDINFNGHIVQVNREKSHNDHFHVKFHDGPTGGTYGPSLSSSVSVAAVGSDGINLTAVPVNTSVTIRTGVVRDAEHNWALLKNTELKVTVKNNAGVSRGKVDGVASTTGWKVKINSEGRLQFSYSTGSVAESVKISVLAGSVEIGSISIDVIIPENVQ